MTRRFLDPIRDELDTLKTDFATLLVTAGDTTAPELNALLATLIDTNKDMVDSVIDDECVIYSTAPSLGEDINATWTAIATFDGATGGDAEFLKTDVPAGSITTTSQIGFTYKSDGFLSFTDLSANRVIEFAVLKNGAPVGFISTITGGGNNKPRTAVFSALDLSNNANDVYQLGIQTPAGAQTIDILDSALALTISPTNNP